VAGNQEQLPEAPRSTSAVACRSVSSGYLGKEVLRDVTFRIDRPAIYVVLGPNGAGKTTLFRTLAGILKPYRGEVLVGGDGIDRQRARDQLHYISHIDGLPDGLTVREALEFYARVEGAGPADVERVVDLLEIRELEGRYLPQLSAGQRKRASIARVFLHERGVYLLDEPTANLDPKVAREIRSLILHLSREKIVLYASHNLFEAREIGEYVLALRDGRVALFDRIDHLRTSRYVVGIRTLAPSGVLDGYPRQGDYYLRELSGPEQVPSLLHELDTRGVQVREIREMGNPLEELFA
jgi:ABC-2 type transport system ATP-binding protein